MLDQKRRVYTASLVSSTATATPAMDQLAVVIDELAQLPDRESVASELGGANV